MKAIICLDKAKGLLFNNRRQSRDSALCDKVAELVGDGVLYLNNYSAPLFDGKCSLSVNEGFYDLADDEDFCFFENVTVPKEKINELYIFLWNRDYPADTYFNIDPKDIGLKRVKKEDFQGTSHKKITLEIYRRG